MLECLRPPYGVVVSNYVAMASSSPNWLVSEGSTTPPDGMITAGAGLNMKSCLDGTSKTIILAETKEPAVNSWYDGTTAVYLCHAGMVLRGPRTGSGFLGRSGEYLVGLQYRPCSPFRRAAPVLRQNG